MSKNITVQLQELDGTVIKESELTLKDGDTLIMKYGESITLQTVQEIFDIFNEALENNERIIAIPKGIELQILNKKEND